MRTYFDELEHYPEPMSIYIIIICSATLQPPVLLERSHHISLVGNYGYHGNNACICTQTNDATEERGMMLAKEPGSQARHSEEHSL